MISAVHLMIGYWTLDIDTQTENSAAQERRGARIAEFPADQNAKFKATPP